MWCMSQVIIKNMKFNFLEVATCPVELHQNYIHYMMCTNYTTNVQLYKESSIYSSIYSIINLYLDICHYVFKVVHFTTIIFRVDIKVESIASQLQLNRVVAWGSVATFIGSSCYTAAPFLVCTKKEFKLLWDWIVGINPSWSIIMISKNF